jgi:hypothetical protein
MSGRWEAVLFTGRRRLRLTYATNTVTCAGLPRGKGVEKGEGIGGKVCISKSMREKG